MRNARALPLLALLLSSAVIIASAPSGASAATCTGLTGLNGTGDPCTPNTIYTNTPDVTANAAPQGQNQTLNGSPLLASLTGAGTLNGFTVTENAGGTSGNWTFTPTPGALFPQYIEVSSGSDWFFTQVAIGTLMGTWSTCPSASLCLSNSQGAAQSLSHIAFFDEGGAPGGQGLGAVPIPAALPLFASGAGFLGLLAWRKKRKPQTTAS